MATTRGHFPSGTGRVRSASNFPNLQKPPRAKNKYSQIPNTIVAIKLLAEIVINPVTTNLSASTTE
jgi:hypothetical protein